MPALPTVVFEALTDPDKLAKWWGPGEFTSPSIELDLRVGGGYRIAMQPPEGELFYLSGEFREIDPPRRLAYTFRWEDPDPDDQETLATLSLRDQGESTGLVLHQWPFRHGAAARASRRGLDRQLRATTPADLCTSGLARRREQTREGSFSPGADWFANPRPVVARDESGRRYLTKGPLMRPFRLLAAGEVSPERASFGRQSGRGGSLVLLVGTPIRARTSISSTRSTATRETRLTSSRTAGRVPAQWTYLGVRKWTYLGVRDPLASDVAQRRGPAPTR